MPVRVNRLNGKQLLTRMVLSATHLSPFSNPFTPSPTSLITPTISCPGISLPLVNLYALLHEGKRENLQETSQ